MVFLKRKVFRDIALQKLLHLEFRWLIRQAWALTLLKTERFFHSGKAPAPLLCILNVTQNCNLRCPMCDLPQRFQDNPQQLDTETWKLVIDQLHETKAAGISFTGGEPTLREDIFELMAYARGDNLPVVLNTNALPITKARLKATDLSMLTNINISLDSGREEINDRLRGGNNILPRTLEKIKLLAEIRESKNLKFAITIVTVLSDLNIEDLEAIFEKLGGSTAGKTGSGADRIGFLPLHEITPEYCKVAKFSKDTSRLVKEIYRLSKKYRLPLENSTYYLNIFHQIMTGYACGATAKKVLPVKCNVGFTTLVVGPDLKLYRCLPFFEKGQYYYQWDPHQENFKDIWNSKNFRQERQAALNCKECYWNCHSEMSYQFRM